MRADLGVGLEMSDPRTAFQVVAVDYFCRAVITFYIVLVGWRDVNVTVGCWHATLQSTSRRRGGTKNLLAG